MSLLKAIRPSELQSWLGTCAQDAVLLDVREPWEFQTACVKADGFTVLHMPMRSVPARLNELSPDRPVACLCHHGGRSAQVAQFLKAQGFQEVVNIHGGINLWSQEVDASVPQY